MLRSGLEVRSPIARIGKKKERKGKGGKKKKGKEGEMMLGEAMDRKNPR